MSFLFQGPQMRETRSFQTSLLSKCLVLSIKIRYRSTLKLTHIESYSRSTVPVTLNLVTIMEIGPLSFEFVAFSCCRSTAVRRAVQMLVRRFVAQKESFDVSDSGLERRILDGRDCCAARAGGRHHISRPAAVQSARLGAARLCGRPAAATRRLSGDVDVLVGKCS